MFMALPEWTPRYRAPQPSVQVFVPSDMCQVGDRNLATANEIYISQAVIRPNVKVDDSVRCDLAP